MKVPYKGRSLRELEDVLTRVPSHVPADFQSFQREIDRRHDHMADALGHYLYGIDYGFETPKKSWVRKLLERFCRWLMDKLDIQEEY